MTVTPTTSLLDRAGLDRDRARQHLARGLEGADDGELFLEYRQSEMLVFDNGRLKQATYDTAQGFGLRAVKDEAVGYAHASDLSEAAIARAADAVRAVKGGYSGQLCRGAGAHQCAPLRRREPARRADLRDQGEAAGDHRRLCARQGSARAAGLGLVRRVLAGGGDPARRRARPIATCGRWCGSTSRWSRATAPARNPAATAMAAAKGSTASSTRRDWQHAVDEAVRQALVNLEAVPAPAGEMDVVLGPGWPGVMLHEAVGHGLEGDFNRKKTSAFAGLMGQRVASKGVTVVDDGTMAQRRGSLSIDDEGTPTEPHRADRGRHPGRLHAGPPERPPDGHGADRQRPARELRPRADAAHDQHLHAGRRRTTRTRSSPRSRTASMRSISAAARSTSRRANTCSTSPRPT